MGSAESIANEFEQLGRDIEGGFNRAIGEIDQLGKSVEDGISNGARDIDQGASELSNILQELSGGNAIRDLFDPPVPMAEPVEPRRRTDNFPSGGIEPAPQSNPDPAVPDVPVPPVNLPGESRHLVPVAPSDPSDESHLEDIVGGDSGSRAGMRLGNGRRLWTIGQPVEPPTWFFDPKANDYNVDFDHGAPHIVKGASATDFSATDMTQLAVAGAVFGCAYFLLSTYGGVVFQALRVLQRAPGNSVYFSEASNQWRWSAGVRDIAGNAFQTRTNLVDLRIQTTNLGYYFRLPSLMRWFRTEVAGRIFRSTQVPGGRIPILAQRMEDTLGTVQRLVNFGDATIKAIISSLVAGLAFNLYDAKLAVDNFQNYSYPGTNTIIPPSLHVGANIANSVMDSGALKILATIPTIFGVTDPNTSLKIVSALWSFGKDLRPGNGQGRVNQAIDNLFNIYIPDALDGRRILDLIPAEVKAEASKMFGNNINIFTSEAMIVDAVKQVANSGELVKILDEIIASVGATADSIDGVDVFWKIFKNRKLDSVLRDAIVGFKTSEPESPINLMAPESGSLDILGFQLYRSNVQTEINSDVGKGATETDSKFANFELHGKYCGAGNPIENGEPIDAFDRACQKHDTGYMQKGMYNSETDAQFVTDLEELLKTETLDQATRLKVKAAKLHFERVTVVRHSKKP